MESLKKMAAKMGGEGGVGGAAGGGGGKGRFSQGIGNAGAINTTLGDERYNRISLILRAVQMLLAFIMLIIAIVLATFQSKWLGSPSGLTGFLIFVACFSLATSAVFAAVPIIHERSDYKTFKGLARAMSEARVGFIVNGTLVGLTLIIALTQTISSLTTKGCKKAENDKSAGTVKGNKADYIKALPGFCTSKKAQAAFCWFLFAAWVLSMLIFLRQWRLTRKNGPRIPPFVHPTDDSAFEPIHAGDDVDDDDRGDYPAAAAAGGRYGDGGDGRYGGGYDAGRRDSYGAPPGAYNSPYPNVRPSYDAHNPFGDVAPPAAARPSYDYGAYNAPHTPQHEADPYHAIQAQLRSGRSPERPPQLPPLYR